eukprot:TRINITY_DN5507_c0_g1_i2.p1 TRINITY_DN5507_c0_g1~~TRINITY_DN5507_c0_g1_i2.p1  ORF type:complete len:277 (-),score=28.80 TRINITY_DN5507_c0_g1_i2:249-1079(-)
MAFWTLNFHERSSVPYREFAERLCEYLFLVYDAPFIRSINMEKFIKRMTNPNVTDPARPGEESNFTYPEELKVGVYLKMMLAFGPFEYFLTKALPCVTREYECNSWWVGLVNGKETRKCLRGRLPFIVRYGNPPAFLVHDTLEAKTQITNNSNSAGYQLSGKRNPKNVIALAPTDVVDAIFKGFKTNLRSADYNYWQTVLQQELNEQQKSRCRAEILHWYIPWIVNKSMSIRAKKIVEKYGYAYMLSPDIGETIVKGPISENCEIFTISPPKENRN